MNDQTELSRCIYCGGLFPEVKHDSTRRRDKYCKKCRKDISEEYDYLKRDDKSKDDKIDDKRFRQGIRSWSNKKNPVEDPNQIFAHWRSGVESYYEKIEQCYQYDLQQPEGLKILNEKEKCFVEAIHNLREAIKNNDGAKVKLTNIAIANKAGIHRKTVCRYRRKMINLYDNTLKHFHFDSNFDVTSKRFYMKIPNTNIYQLVTKKDMRETKEGKDFLKKFRVFSKEKKQNINVLESRRKKNSLVDNALAYIIKKNLYSENDILKARRKIGKIFKNMPKCKNPTCNNKIPVGYRINGKLISKKRETCSDSCRTAYYRSRGMKPNLHKLL